MTVVTLPLALPHGTVRHRQEPDEPNGPVVTLPLALPHGTVRHRQEPDEPHGPVVVAPQRDVYLGRNDVAGIYRQRRLGWPLRPAVPTLRIGAAEAAGLPSGLDDMASSASNFVPGPSPGSSGVSSTAGLRSAARQAGRAPGTQLATHPAAAGVVALSAAGLGLLVFTTWICIKDFRDARKSIQEQRPEREIIKNTLQSLSIETPTVLQQALMRQAQTELAKNTYKRQDDWTMLLFPGAMGTVGTLAGGLSLLFYPKMFGAFAPGLVPAVLPLMYVATPLAFVFTAAEGILRGRDCVHAFKLGRGLPWLDEHPLVGNEQAVRQLLQRRLRAMRFWSGSSAASYWAAAIGGPLSLGFPTAGLAVLLASAVGILISDNMLEHYVLYEPQLDVQERLAYASPHSIVNAVEEIHSMHAHLKALRKERGLGYATLLGARHGVRWHLASAWQRCFGPGEQRSSRSAMEDVIDAFLTAELVRVRAEELVLQEFMRQAGSDADTVEDLEERRQALLDKQEALGTDIAQLPANLDAGPEGAVFWLLRFFTRDNLFKPLALEIVADKALSELLEDHGLFRDDTGDHDLDANAMVLALTEGSLGDAPTTAWAVQRLYELAERVMLTVAKKRMCHLERELLDMLAERLLVEVKAEAEGAAEAG